MPKANPVRRTSKTIEQRLEAIENRIAELATLIEIKLEPKRDSREAIGVIAGNDAMREFFEEALKQREADQIKSRTGLDKPLATVLPSRDEWKQTLGIFGPEDGMEEVFEEAMKLREVDREKARRAEARRKSASRRRKVTS